MPTTRKRRLHSARLDGITPAAIDAWHRRDYDAVDQLCGVRPWQPSIIEAKAEHPPSWADKTSPWAQGWVRSHDLRVALEAAAKEIEQDAAPDSPI